MRLWAIKHIQVVMLSAVMIQILNIASLNKLNVMAVCTLDSEVLMILL